MNRKCEISFEAADEITVSVLKDMRRSLIFDLKTKGGIFVTDSVKDAEIIRQHIKAIDLILKYFGK